MGKGEKSVKYQVLKTLIIIAMINRYNKIYHNNEKKCYYFHNRNASIGHSTETHVQHTRVGSKNYFHAIKIRLAYIYIYIYTCGFGT